MLKELFVISLEWLNLIFALKEMFHVSKLLMETTFETRLKEKVQMVDITLLEETW